MKLEEFFSDPVRTREYKEWLNNPVTVRIIEILEEISPPVALDMGSGNLSEQSLYLHGFNLGQRTTLNLLKGLDATSAKLQETKKMLIPDYGASVNATY